ncbi:MAG: hypothetical protein KA956_14760 [Pyrinomonadaceae bacterium]|nr:hypothetical protein [Acidobacteriota bacterium]MBP7377728.1 hypothetical protein [Pyrinomonadaceae bacterium]
MRKEENLIKDLPDADAARRFLGQFTEQHAAQHEKLLRQDGLLSDVLTLVSFSPLLATTLLQHPDYIWWLGRKRLESGVRSREELIESLARFALTNSQLDPQVLFARFRRRELLRIYLRDIRRLATIAEITEEISNLADAILETALERARHEIDNRFGHPQEADDKGRFVPSGFCIAALGKLGSKELNYSSDIDLLFIYSAEGKTTGGSRESVTNREYYVKLAEYITKLVGSPSGEGAAYRVDLRLRPHGSLGALALSVGDMIRYFKTEARAWERQVLIRSRGCAGDTELFKQFFGTVEDLIFSKKQTIETALANVRRSKERIDQENINRRGFDVKLGRGGIREIEFLAQALQLAYGGKDKWLRSPHTLISLSRLADRKYISKAELSELSTAYEFLRRTEHILQMKNGVQTHTVPDDPDKRGLVARKMSFASAGDFEADLTLATDNVSRIFTRIFGETPAEDADLEVTEVPNREERTRSHVLESIEKSDVDFDATESNVAVLDKLVSVSPHFAAMLAANPQLAVDLPDPEDEFEQPDYEMIMSAAIDGTRDFGHRLSAMRKVWSRLLLELVVRDIFGKLGLNESKRAQTELAEASIKAALEVVRDELAHRYRPHDVDLDLAILALGKLGGRGLDYDSDLDLVMVYFDPGHQIAGVTAAEFYARAVELFSTTLSSMTRDGNLYRVDLRLRPFGSKGMTAISIDAFLDYMRDKAAVWEMLAFVKLRAVGGDQSLARNVESETRRIIHERALTVDTEELRTETRRVRLALEKERTRSLRGGDIDIKYGSGGMLDIYFAMRYLQLRDNVPDVADRNGEEEKRRSGADENPRSTSTMLDKLEQHHREASSLPDSSTPLLPLSALRDGHTFLSALDHQLRLTIGRTTRLSISNQTALATIAERMGLGSPAELLEHLTAHRLAIREAFDAILPDLNR